jgi:hypothetical protein
MDQPVRPRLNIGLLVVLLSSLGLWALIALAIHALI